MHRGVSLLDQLTFREHYAAIASGRDSKLAFRDDMTCHASRRAESVVNATALARFFQHTTAPSAQKPQICEGFHSVMTMS